MAYVVYDNKVLFILHKEMKKWLPLGGHIELEEDSDQALFREVREESGIEDIEILADKSAPESSERKPLYTPNYLDIHPISDTHKHIGMVYFIRAKSGKVQLAEKKHDDIRWFSETDLDDPQFNIDPGIKFYAKEAINRAKQ